MKICKKKPIIYLTAILLLILLEVNILSAQILNNSEKVEIDVLNRIDKISEISIIVKLNLRNDTIRDFVLSNLSPSEFKLKGKHLREDGFAGNITKEGLYRLINDPNVRIIYLDRIASVTMQQSLPLINATKVWIEGYTGKGQTICVIDSGVNSSHPYLKGRIVAEKCFCSSCLLNNLKGGEGI